MDGKYIYNFLPDGARQRGAAAADSREREAREMGRSQGGGDDDEDADEYRGRRREYRRLMAYQICHRGP